MLLGDSSVGKTCILLRFKDGAFVGGNFIATVGIDFRVSAILFWKKKHTKNNAYFSSHLSPIPVTLTTGKQRASHS